MNTTHCVPVKFVPLIVTCVPTGPLLGVNEVIVGTPFEFTKKLPPIPVPAAFVTEIEPCVAPLGTTVVSCVSDATWNVAGVPLNATCVVPVKLTPVTVTLVPTDPLVGEKKMF